MKKIFAFLLLFSVFAVLTGCANDTVKEESVTITYVTNGGNEIASEKVDKADYETFVPQIPAKDGYVFAGWYIDESFENSYDGLTTGEMTLYAKWEEESFVMPSSFGVSVSLDLFQTINTVLTTTATGNTNSESTSTSAKGTISIMAQNLDNNNFDEYKLLVSLTINQGSSVSAEIFRAQLDDGKLYIKTLSFPKEGGMMPTENKMVLDIESLIFPALTILGKLAMIPETSFDYEVANDGSEFDSMYLLLTNLYGIAVAMNETPAEGEAMDLNSLIVDIVNMVLKPEEEYTSLDQVLALIGLDEAALTKFGGAVTSLIPTPTINQTTGVIKYEVTNAMVMDTIDKLAAVLVEYYNSINNTLFGGNENIYTVQDAAGNQYLYNMAETGYYVNGDFVSYFTGDYADEDYYYSQIFGLYYRKDGIYGILDEDNSFIGFNDELLGWYDSLGVAHKYEEDFKNQKYGSVVDTLYMANYESLVYATTTYEDAGKAFVKYFLAPIIAEDTKFSGYLEITPTFNAQKFELGIDISNFVISSYGSDEEMSITKLSVDLNVELILTTDVTISTRDLTGYNDISANVNSYVSALDQMLDSALMGATFQEIYESMLQQGK